MNGKLGVGQQAHGAFDAVLIEIADRGGSRFLLEDLVHIPCGKMHQIRQLLFAGDGGVILLDVVANGANVHRVGVGAVGLIDCRVERKQTAKGGNR